MDDSDFIRFLGQLVFDPENSTWDTLTPQQQAEYCRFAQQKKLGTLFVRFLDKKLPEEFYRDFRKNYRIQSQSMTAEHKDLDELYRLLESAKIPFIPVKGADLAFRIYPDAALRPHEDWDILFREADCPRALKLLQEHGWRTYSGYEAGVFRFHHYEQMYKGKHVIEVHWTLPNFGSAGEDDFWRETIAVNEYHHVFTPEMNLLLLGTHASNNHYTHLSLRRILTDSGFILRHDEVDWTKIHELADRWDIVRPDILFGAWSEFYPAGTLPAESMNPETQLMVWDIFQTRGQMIGYSSYEYNTARQERFSRIWFRNVLSFYNPALISKKYHIAPHQNGRIILYGIRDFIGKAFYFLTYSRSRNAKLQNYLRKVEDFERFAKRKK